MTVLQLRTWTSCRLHDAKRRRGYGPRVAKFRLSKKLGELLQAAVIVMAYIP